jgi:hypothetical protein
VVTICTTKFDCKKSTFFPQSGFIWVSEQTAVTLLHLPIVVTIGEKQVESLECFNSLDSIITNDARCTRKIKYSIAMTEAAFNRKKSLFTIKFGLNLREEKLVKYYIWSTVLYGAETWTLRKDYQKYVKFVLEKDGEDHLTRSCKR